MVLPYCTFLCPRYETQALPGSRQKADQSMCHELRLTTPNPSLLSGQVLSAQTLGSMLCSPTLAHLHLWQQRTRSSCCTRSDRNWGRQRGRRILDSSSGRQGPLCSWSYLTHANAASKTCQDREGKLWQQILPVRGAVPEPPNLRPSTPSTEAVPGSLNLSYLPRESSFLSTSPATPVDPISKHKPSLL